MIGQTVWIILCLLNAEKSFWLLRKFMERCANIRYHKQHTYFFSIRLYKKIVHEKLVHVTMPFTTQALNQTKRLESCLEEYRKYLTGNSGKFSFIS